MRGLQVLALVAFASLFACETDSRDLTAPPTSPFPHSPMASIGMDPGSGATIETNQDDYAPGELVRVTGSHWAPGETVHLDMTEDPDTHGDVTQDVQADSTGAFSIPFYDVQDHDLGVTFTLTATGLTSGSKATAVFTDATSLKAFGVDDGQHTQINNEENLGTVAKGTNVGLTCPRGTGLTVKASGVAGTQAWSIGVAGAGTDNATLSPLTTLTPNSGSFTSSNSQQCVAVSITTGSLTVGTTYHGTLQASGSGASPGDYFFRFTVTNPVKTTPTITWANPADVVYGTSLTSTQLNATASVAGTFNYTPVSGAVLNAGGGQTLHVDFTPNDQSLYNNASKDVSINVLKANASVVVSGYTGTYDGASHGATGSATGVGGANLSTSLNLGATYTNVPGGIAHWTFSGGTNYNDQSGDIVIVIYKADATVSVSGYTGVYDGNAHGASGTATGVVGEILSGLNLGATFTDVPGGTAHWTFSGGTNYNDQSGDAPIVINKADATITVTGYNGVYDGLSHTATGSATGLKGEDLSGLLVISGTYSNAPGGQAYWVFNSGGLNVDYNAATGNVAIEITKAPSTAVVTCPANVTYSGSPQEPCSASITGAGGLSQSPSIDYTNNVNAGTATASASFAGDDNHTGSSDSTTFTIDKAGSTTTVLCPASVTYDGSAQSPCTAVATGAGALNQALTVVYTNNEDAGTATASASFDGDANHESSSSYTTFTIDKAPSVTTVSCPAGPYTYDGSAQTPCSASVTGAGGLSQTLTVNYANNTNAGTATASASYGGDGNHESSSDSKTFTIDKAPSTTTVTCPAGPYTYNGSAQTPCSASVSGAGGLSQSLSVSYLNNANAGTATASASFAGDDNHFGSSGSATFTIDKASSSTTVTCPAGPYTYDGSAQTPCSASVSGAGGLSQTLPVSYLNNTDAGTATASARFAGDDNHNGSNGSSSFTIDKASSSTALTCPTNVTYTGSALTPCSASAMGAGGLNQPLTVGYTNNVNAGTATASASYAGDANHTGSSDSRNFTIDKALSTTTISCPASVTYTGSPQTPCAAGVTGAGGLNQSLTVNYANNVVGTATASATYAGDGNHYGSSDSKTFTILYVVGGTCYGNAGHQILQPINADGTSVFKQGSTVPAKFRVCDANGNSIGTAGVVVSFKLVQTLNGLEYAAANEDVVSTTPDASFRWSSTDQQWIFNMNTKLLGGSKTYFYEITLNDGSKIKFSFGLK